MIVIKPFINSLLANIQGVAELKSEHEYEKYIQECEKEFAEYNKSKYAIAVNSLNAFPEHVMPTGPNRPWQRFRIDTASKTRSQMKNSI